MKSARTYAFTLLVTLTFFACSPEDNSSIPEEDTNEFTFNGETYNLTSVIISDENTSSDEPSTIGISIFNKTSSEITGNSDLEALTFVYFDLNAVNIQNTTYSDINDYNISIDGTILDSEFSPGTVLLSDNDPDANVYAQSGTVTVTNFTEFNIVFSFTFTRNDGQVIFGSYDGNYLAP